VYGINNAGQAVGSVGAGSSVCPTVAGCAVIWSDDTPSALGAVKGAYGSEAYAINNTGQVVGIAIVRKSSSSLDEAVIWNSGTPTVLPAPGSQYEQSYANSINDAGEVVGSAVESGDTGEIPVEWNGLTPTVLSMASGCTGNSGASAVNSNSLVVGATECGTDQPVQEAVVWHGTIATLLPEVKSRHAPSGKALAVNDSGLVVGTANNSASDAYATAWQGKVVTNLGVLENGNRSAATAVNSQGIIVGQSATVDYSEFHAALWSRVGGQTQDLNALIGTTQASEYLLTDAVGINDSCTIVANGYNKKTGATASFLLTLIDASNCVNGM